ncbi:MAG: hypothetical protein KatS3mg061_0275 [Dehalococcoidia bacterium]|nr:MAG: hypothetical protein KatS3mg061_0275 [Dehalococcoidia bacterium]
MALACEGGDPFLDQRDVLEGELNSQVAACHHHAIAHVYDRLEVVERLGLLDLGDDEGAGALTAE